MKWLLDRKMCTNSITCPLFFFFSARLNANLSQLPSTVCISMAVLYENADDEGEILINLQKFFYAEFSRTHCNGLPVISRRRFAIEFLIYSSRLYFFRSLASIRIICLVPSAGFF